MAFIEGIAFSGYRSFGKPQALGLCQRINIISGQNNCGKSNILKFLSEQLPKIDEAIRQKKANFSYSELDTCVDFDGPITITLGMEIGGERYKKLLQACPIQFQHHGGQKAPENVFEKIFACDFILKAQGGIWFDYSFTGNAETLTLPPGQLDKIKSNQNIPQQNWYNVWTALTGSGGGNIDLWIRESIYKIIYDFLLPKKKVFFIPAIRQISKSLSNEERLSETWNGDLIIERLNRLQHPIIQSFSGFQREKEKFFKITDFVRNVLEDSEVEIEISHDKSTIIISKDNRVLPLEHLGTGIHQILILAIAATYITDSIVCMEEPELYLHPTLQRKLIEYLYHQTDNQYFITTHSSALLDSANAAVFHVKLSNGYSVIQGRITPSDKAEICDDLGYKASDLFQSNCIIWVEGPSDRIYLIYWLHTYCNENGHDVPVEGVHYTIMFYGGKLLSHLSAEETDEDEVNRLIRLRKINRYMSIIMDSDKEKEADEINNTKKRIEAELSNGKNGLTWITEGREIENYIKKEVLLKVIQKLHANSEAPSKFGEKYSKNTKYKKPDGKLADVDKISLAHEVVNLEPEIDVLDLKEQLAKLFAFIQKANNRA